MPSLSRSQHAARSPGLLDRARRHPSFAVGSLITALLVLAALISLVWQPYPPADINIANKLQAPSAAHWLGTDSLGRDIASQLWVGSQNSIVVGLVAVGIGLGLGVALGCWAASAKAAGRAWIDDVLMRAADFSFAFPALLTAIMLTAIYGPGLLMSIVAIGIFNVPVFARITRAAANSVWQRDYVTAARAAGKGPGAITRDHVLPNIASPLIVQASISFATAILAEAALSFLGLGTQPPQPSWGRMLNEAQTMIFQAPMLAVYPGVAIMLSVLGLNLMGDGLRDLLDPKLMRQR
jgi:peptide/nickel transport system permease protein